MSYCCSISRSFFYKDVDVSRGNAVFYEFLYAMYCELERLRAIAGNGGEIIAHSVLDEIILCLIVEEAEFLIEEENLEKDNNWGDWVYDIFDDMDVRTMLYSNWYISEDNCYHFSHWLKNQFYCD